METKEAVALALECGFSQAGELNVGALEFLPEVRDMCADGRCRKYGTSWACPPACGTLEESAAQAARYRRGVLVQSTGELEDEFDIESMQEIETLHKKRFNALVDRVRALDPGCLPMAAGGCTVCTECTYPDAPCRFPEKAVPSMEAYGLFVSRVCERSGMKYFYGPRTMTFTSCILID